MSGSKTNPFWAGIRDRLRAQLDRLDFAGEWQLARLQVDVTGTDPWLWLKGQGQGDRVYWQSRDGCRETAGLGLACLIDSTTHDSLGQGVDAIRRQIEATDSDLRFYGGVAFNQNEAPSGSWKDLGRFRFVVPRFEIRRVAEESRLSMVVLRESDQAAALAQGIESLSPGRVEQSRYQVVSRDVTPTRRQWCEQMEVLRDELGLDLEKLVLACRESIQCAAPVDALGLLEVLRRQTRHSFQFFFSSSEWAFLGCSPEKLYERQGRTVGSEAMAGTQRVGAIGAPSLLESRKDNLEHDYVVRDMREAFDKLEGRLEGASPKSVVSWNSLQHLSTPLVGTLPSGCTDAGIIQTLHPSAAVLGYPRPRAWQRLEHYESFRRGWYAGPVGWIGQDSAEFAVAIRSALVRGKALELYAGAGIVKGSEPQQEWQEIQSKMRHYHEALGIHQPE